MKTRNERLTLAAILIILVLILAACESQMQEPVPGCKWPTFGMIAAGVYLAAFVHGRSL